MGPVGRRAPLPAASPQPWQRTAARSAPASITPSAARRPKLGGAEHLIRLVLPEGDLRDRPGILVRARAKITTARIPYAIPADTELAGRLAAVLAVVYLIATEAHAPTGGYAVARVDLEAEAIRLARLLASLMPDEPEALPLLALLLLTSARTPPAPTPTVTR